MKKIEYRITLLSDAEPGTGVGGELVNQRIPRDARDRPVITANHLKGLLREELMAMESVIGLDGLADRALGKPDDEKPISEKWENEACCRFSDATLDEKSNGTTDYVTRTAIDSERGNAKGTSLRTTERIAVGTVFRGKIILSGNGTSQEERAILAGLLAIRAVGGGRNRGMGKIIIKIDGESRKPGDIFRQLADAPRFARKIASPATNTEPSEKLQTLRLTFTADEPLCCPEKPIVAGAIESGFAISPSAVRGWIVSRMAKEYGDELASSLYSSKELRAWPMLPCGMPGESENLIPTRVSVTHKTAKLVLEGKPLREKEVEDKPIIEVGTTPSNNPLKASDGVLLSDGGTVKLWKSGSMPRVASAHGVHNDRETEDGRNLYQTVSMAPLVWTGIVTIPDNWARLLIDSVQKDHSASFGRFRSTRGLGQIKIDKISDDVKGLPWSKTDYDDILILQSSILLDGLEHNGQPANQEFEAFIRHQWSGLFQDGKLDVRAISTNMGVRFGWNRNGLGEMTGKGGRQKACRVVLPGSVFRIYKKGLSEEECRGEKHDESRKCVEQNGPTLRQLIRSGLGHGVERGFGDVSVHPGMATEIFSPHKGTENPSRGSSTANVGIAKEILKIWRENRNHLPSASQISAVAGKAAKSRKDAITYLEGQVTRIEKIWATWNPIQEDIKTILEKEKKYDSNTVQMGLKLLMDLVKYNKKANEKEVQR